jgi:hypothetical protein
MIPRFMLATPSRRQRSFPPSPRNGEVRTKTGVEPCRHVGRAGRHPRLPVVSYGLTVWPGHGWRKSDDSLVADDVIE